MSPLAYVVVIAALLLCALHVDDYLKRRAGK